MTTEIDDAIKALAKQAGEAKAPHEAMQLAQAALNLAHAKATLSNIKD